MSLDINSNDEHTTLMRVVLSKINIVADTSAFFKEDYLYASEWGAVIFGGDFRDADRKVSEVLGRLGVEKVFCGGLADYMTDSYRLTSDHADLEKVRQKYHEPSYFITDMMSSFCIISDSDYYWGIAANKQFMLSAFEKKISNTIEDFYKDIDGMKESVYEHDLKIYNILIDYASICRKSCKKLGIFN